MSDPNGPTEQHWWQDFFGGPWLDIHHQLRSPRQTEAECDFLDEVLELDGSSRVLDVPCGNGRHSVELASRGCSVTGVDFSAAMLDFARSTAQQRRVDVQWVRRDMRALELEGSFDAAVNFWGSFGYFDLAGDQALAAGVARALRPGGRFLIDTPVAETVLQGFQHRAWHTVGDKILLEDRHYDALSGRLQTEWTVVYPDGAKRTMISSIRLYSLPELRDLLRSVGFETFAGFSSLDGTAFHVGAPRLYLVATMGKGDG